MKKTEIIKRNKEKQIEYYNEFIEFVKHEGFIETIGQTGCFSENVPVFYKKVSENIFLAFNIPFYKKIKDLGFCADFWRINAKSENEFIKSKVKSENLIDLRLGFSLERDFDFYNEELSKYNKADKLLH